MRSRFNDDLRTVRDGRRKILKSVDVRAPYQSSEKLRQQLIEKNFGVLAREAWTTGNNEREIWLERQREYLKDWDEFLTSTSQGAFTGSSTLHLPMPLIVARAMHARFLEALIGTDTPFSVKPRVEASVDRARVIQDVMAYAINTWGNRNTGIEEEADKWLWDFVTVGSGIMKMRWACDYEKISEIQSEQRQGVPLIHQNDDGSVELRPQYSTKWKEVETQLKTWEGPQWWRRNHEDVLMIGGEGDPQRAELLIDRDFMMASDMWSLADEKVFNADAVEAVIASGPDMVSGQQTSQIKDIRTMNAGKASADSAHAVSQYMILEVYTGIDLDGSGIDTQIVAWVHWKTCEILRASYLRRIAPEGERPFFKIDFHKRPGSEYGVGIIEIMHPLSVEMDAIHNMRVDFGLLSTMPFGFYKPTSSIDPTVLQLEPGALIPTDNPGDVYFPNFGNRTAYGFQEEQGIQTIIERLTSLNDMTFGSMSGSQGATRTATGAQGLMNETNSNLGIFIRRMNRGWRRLLFATLHLLQRRLPDGLEFRVTGETGDEYFLQIHKREAIHGDFDFDISPTAETSSLQARQQLAGQLMQATANPFDVQLGLVKPENRYEALKTFYKALGIKDFNKYLTKPAGYTYSPTPEEEINRVLHGIPVQVTPGMDHDGYLSAVQEIFAHDELLGQFDKQQAAALHVQALKHVQAKKVFQQMQAQQANKQQMAMNAQLGTGGAGAGAAPQMANASQAKTPQPMMQQGRR